MNNSFTNDEWDFLTQPSPMRLRPGIQDKINLKLSSVKQELSKVIDKYRMIFPAWKDDSSLTAKIYRGENYLGMPWMALDFPKNYGKNNSLAFRVLVLWGDAIYTSMLMEEGVELKHSESPIDLGTIEAVYFITNENRWIQAIEEDSCELIQEFDSVFNHRKLHGFTRLFQKIAFSKWETLEAECARSFEIQCEISRKIRQMHQDV